MVPPQLIGLVVSMLGMVAGSCCRNGWATERPADPHAILPPPPQTTTPGPAPA